MELALRSARVSAEEVDYINLHGTSTRQNDRVETIAVRALLGGRAKEVPASATKSMIGHSQGASGAAGVVATILGMREGFLPPTINYEAPDPECDLDYVPNRARPARARLALCNCIGFGSKNSAIVLRAVDP